MTNLSRNPNDCYIPPTISNPLRDKVQSDSNDVPLDHNAIIWKPDPDSGASCLTSQEILNFGHWMRWMETNYLSKLCTQLSEDCYISIGPNRVPLANALSTCVQNLSSQNNMLQKVTGQDSIEGSFIPLDLDCAELQNLLLNCLQLGSGGVVPAQIFGLDRNLTTNALNDIYRYPHENQGTTRFIIECPQDDTNNLYNNLAAGQRLIPQNTATRISENLQGGSYNAVSGSFTVGNRGWYTVDLNFQHRLFYTPSPGLATARATVIYGLKHTDASNRNAETEYRMCQPMKVLQSGITQPVHSNGSIDLYLESGDTITPRFWLAGTHPTQIDVQIGSGTQNQWGIFLNPDQDINFLGEG